MINPICIKNTSAVAMMTKTVFIAFRVSGSIENAGALMTPARKANNEANIRTQA